MNYIRRDIPLFNQSFMETKPGSNRQIATNIYGLYGSIIDGDQRHVFVFKIGNVELVETSPRNHELPQEDISSSR